MLPYFCSPTFLRICRKKTTEGFQSLPYVVALFSAMIWLYYASLKSDVLLLITINTVGCFIEMVYIALYVAYAPKQARVHHDHTSFSAPIYIFVSYILISLQNIFALVFADCHLEDTYFVELWGILCGSSFLPLLCKGIKSG
jgi:hypothetical protein